MDGTAYLGHLAAEGRRFLACLDDGATDAPVEHCGGWTLYDLADHLGRGQLWAAAAVTELRGDYDAPAAPREPRALRTWFDQTCTVLTSVLGGDPDAPAWTLYPPRTVAFWRRRRCHESLVHRWDAEHALGRAGALDPVLADDGVSEVFDTMAPRQVDLGRTPAPATAVRLVATDTGTTWTYGPGDPVATVSGTAADLLLLLWRRRRRDDPAVRCQGDRAAAARWLGAALTP